MRGFLLLALLASPLFANWIEAGPVATSAAGSTLRASVKVSWKNAWSNAKNHDAAWVFLKFRTAPGGWRHARLLESGHSSASAVPAKFSVPADRAGAFVFPSEAYRGDVDWTLTLRVDPASLAGFGGG